MLLKPIEDKLGIVVTCFNRPEYTAKCLKSIYESMQNAHIIRDFVFLLIDDNSNDAKAIKLFEEFQMEAGNDNHTGIKSVELIKTRNEKSLGIEENLKYGFNLLFEKNCRLVMNLDNDAIVKKDCIDRIIQVHNAAPPRAIVTGFNSNSRNKNGSERHRLIKEHNTYNERLTVGGINMCMNQSAYKEFMLPTLEKGKGNWDHKTCLNLNKVGMNVYCVKPSVVQHIGFKSSLGHNYSNEPIDEADDFYDKLKLPQVTLIGVDCIAWERLEFASLKCIKGITFGAVKMLTSKTNTHDIWSLNVIEGKREWINIPHFNGKEAYSEFVIRKLNAYVNTSHALIFQFDGYVVNPMAWKDEWLQYDYIGATWGYKDNMNVGNGGFSLRSKKLLDILATDPAIKITHPEDHVICRIYREYLIENHNIKFAPEEVANEFSIEAYGSHVFQGANRYNGQFGFHGGNVDFSHSPIKK